MATNQLHGKNFEDMIKSLFRGSSDQKREMTSKFDIESRFDKILNLNTSIKTTKRSNKKSEVFSLSDARRIFSIDEDFRMLIGLYDQSGGRKKFTTILEYVVRKEDLDKLKGDVSFEEVEEFHNGLRSFPEGKHKEARAYHKKVKPSLQSKCTIRLDPKVDSGKQRRLQCSIRRKDLESVLKPEQIIIHEEEYKDLLLPIIIKSGEREFKSKK